MFKLNKRYIVEQLEKNKTVVFDGDSSTLYTLNETATIVYQLVKKNKTISEISEYLCKRYNVEIKQINQDVKKIIDDFLAKKIFFRTVKKTLHTKITV